MSFCDLMAHFFLVLIFWVWIYHSLLIQSLTGCVQVLTVMNKAALYLCAGFYVGMFRLLWVNTKEPNARLYGKSRSSFLGNHLLSSEVAVPFCIPTSE